jgi:hypothetical protein
MNARNEDRNEGGVLRSVYNFLTYPFRKVWEVVSNPSKAELMEQLEVYRLREQQNITIAEGQNRLRLEEGRQLNSTARRALKEAEDSKAEVVKLKEEVSKLKSENTLLESLVNNLKESLGQYTHFYRDRPKPKPPTKEELAAAEERQKELEKHRASLDPRLKPITAEEWKAQRAESKRIDAEKDGPAVDESLVDGNYDKFIQIRQRNKWIYNKIDTGVKKWDDLSGADRLSLEKYILEVGEPATSKVRREMERYKKETAKPSGVSENDPMYSLAYYNNGYRTDLEDTTKPKEDNPQIRAWRK